MSDVAPLDPERLIQTLARHGVRYVLIGALGATLYGFPRLTDDADVTPGDDRENLERLAVALRELQARVFVEQVPEGLVFDCSAATLARGEIWNLVTAAGRLDLAFRPSGTEGYEDLVRKAVRFEVFGTEILVASLADLIRSKEAAGRPKDRSDVLLLRELQRRIDPEQTGH